MIDSGQGEKQPSFFVRILFIKIHRLFHLHKGDGSAMAPRCPFCGMRHGDIRYDDNIGTVFIYTVNHCLHIDIFYNSRFQQRTITGTDRLLPVIKVLFKGIIAFLKNFLQHAFYLL